MPLIYEQGTMLSPSASANVVFQTTEVGPQSLLVDPNQGLAACSKLYFAIYNYQADAKNRFLYRPQTKNIIDLKTNFTAFKID